MLKNQCLTQVLDVYDWELQHLPFVCSVVGRHVYSCIAKNVLSHHGDPHFDSSLKRLFSSNHFTDRAIRLKLRELECQGYISTFSGSLDARARSLMPSKKLLELIDMHSVKTHQVLSRDYYFVRKI
jgi:hypothetical protein